MSNLPDGCTEFEIERALGYVDDRGWPTEGADEAEPRRCVCGCWEVSHIRTRWLEPCGRCECPGFRAAETEAV